MNKCFHTLEKLTHIKNIIMKNNNLTKALLNEGLEKEFNIDPEKVWEVSYEFHKFYEFYKDTLKENYSEHLKEILNDIIETGEVEVDPLCEYPLFCLTAFATSYNEYKEKDDE